MMKRCGRPRAGNKRKQPCRMWAMSDVDACEHHATAEERARSRYLLHVRHVHMFGMGPDVDPAMVPCNCSPEERQPRRPVMDESGISPYPACWSWPVSDGLRQRVADGDGWEAMYDWQDNRCAACGRSLRGGVIDHDHNTGWVRGFLCQSCNLREGHATSGDNHPITRRLLRYRRWHPTKILGVWERYDHPLRGDDYGILAGHTTKKPHSVSAQGVVLLEDWLYSLANSPAFAVASAFEAASSRYRGSSPAVSDAAGD